MQNRRLCAANATLHDRIPAAAGCTRLLKLPSRCVTVSFRVSQGLQRAMMVAVEWVETSGALMVGRLPKRHVTRVSNLQVSDT